MNHYYVTIHLGGFHARDKSSAYEAAYDYVRHANARELLEGGFDASLDGSCETDPTLEDCSVALSEEWE